MPRKKFLDEEEEKQKTTVIDLIYPARFKDIYCFISLKEIIEGKKKLEDTRFIYTNEYDFNDSELNTKLIEDNYNVSITGNRKKTLVFKKDIYEIFKLYFLEDKKDYKDVFSNIDKYQKSLNKEISGIIKVILPGDSKDQRDLVKNKVGYLDRKDLSSFIKNNIKEVNSNDPVTLKNQYLPRICDDSFLSFFLNREGGVESSTGYFLLEH